MGDIAYKRTGTIKSIEGNSITIEMKDTGESISWPIQDNSDESDITDTLQIGEEINIRLHISDDPFEGMSKSNEEQMRKTLEELVN